MKAKSKTTFFLLLIILVGITMFLMGSAYSEYKDYQKNLINNEGLIKACEEVSYSEDLFFVLKSLDKYTPKIFARAGYISLDFGNEIQNSGGVGLLFDENYKLIDKFCSHTWENGTNDLLKR